MPVLRAVVGGLATALLLFVGVTSAVGAQVRPDSLVRDTLRRAPADSAKAPSPLPADSAGAIASRAGAAAGDTTARTAPDTLQAPLASWPTPPSTETLRPLVWDRKALLATGAVQLTDLLDRVPGVTSFRTSWIAGVHTAAYLGEFSRIRIFLDGVELDSPDPRTGGVLDHADVPLLAIDEVRVERTAGELRVWVRSFATTSTTAYTRTDVLTGDLNTNGFRGMLGRRWQNGVALAITAQQVESQRQRGGGIFASPGAAGSVGDGDLTQYTVRGGWTRGDFATDIMFASTRRSRDPTEAREEAWSLPAYEGLRRETTTRLGWRMNAATGFWAQGYASSLRTQPEAPETTSSAGGSDSDTTGVAARRDSVRSRAQRALVVGWRDARSQAALTARWRDLGNGVEFAPVLQASHDRGWGVVSLHAERTGLDSARRVDASAVWRLRPWLRVGGGVSAWRPETLRRVAADVDTTGGDSEPADSLDSSDLPKRSSRDVARLELTLGWRDRWLTAGVLRERRGGLERDVFVPRLLTPFDSGLSLPRFPASDATALTVGFDGHVYKAIRLESSAIRWSAPREWRPRTQINSQLVLETPWLSRFPKGQFGVNLRLIHEYRGELTAFVPTSGGGYDTRTTEPMNLGHVLLEIRILRAIISYQYRNIFGTAYEQVPGITMPPPHQFYGVRWEWSG